MALPKGDEYLEDKKGYLKLSTLEKKGSILRFVSQPIAGWVVWSEGNPHRFHPDNKPFKFTNPKEKPKKFWTYHVWSYEKQDLFIWEITQATILTSLRALEKDPEWGEITNYDIEIIRKGEGMKSDYTINPVIKSPLDEKIKKSIKQRPVALEALYSGLNPWEVANEKASA